MMQRRGPVLLALLTLVAPACGSEHLDLAITLDASMRDRVARFVINVLEPSDDTWSCDGIAFDERSDSELQSVLVATTSVAVGSQTESALAVQRAARQLIVAYGYAEDGNLLVAGCGERGRGASGTIAVRAVRVAVLAAPALADLIGDAPGQLPATIAVTVRDPLGEAIADTVVRLATDGPGGFARVTEARTDALGFARFEKELGALSGPYALRARAPWTLGPNTSVTSFEPMRTSTFALTGEPRQVFALAAERRPEGRDSVVGSSGSSSCTQGVFAIADGRIGLAAVADCPALVLAAVGARDEVFVLSATAGTIGVSRLTSLDPVSIGSCGQVTLPAGFESCTATRALDADPCGRSGRLTVALDCLTAPTSVQAVVLDVATCPAALVPMNAGAPQLPANAAVVATGCLDVDGVPTNVAIARQELRDVLVSDKAPAVARRVKGPTTFYDFSVVDGRHVLLGAGTTNGATQLTAFAVLNEAGEDAYGIDPVATFDVPSEPLAATSADFDGDGQLDAFGLVKGGGSARQNVLVCVGRTGGTAVCASGPEIRTEDHTSTLASDLDGDGFDDLVSLGNPNKSGWLVQASSLQERAP